ncbi:hypothetical protein Forpe1208_v005104 [Fusarium oxysporum f. sp. rapae]|uniref:Uncharacterized protein n=1 Tax=Fusarium oxysporum f. sp. rapae TaxID=485398 RepID=A0A8J5P2R3_FUSOX|nr:hypothetical protein Forpe1208_v005104 [Fusarium oxysporum f. sp. rapae]
MSNQRQDIALNPSGWSYATEQSSRARRSLIRHKRSPRPQGEDFRGEVTSVQEPPPGLDLTDAKKETDEVIPNQLGVMVGLLLPLHYHIPKDSNLIGTFEPDTGHVIPDPSQGGFQIPSCLLRRVGDLAQGPDEARSSHEELAQRDHELLDQGSQQDRNIAGAHGGRVKEEPANGPDWMVIDSIPSLVSRQQGRASDTGHAFNSAPVDRPNQMMIESDPSLPGRENLQQDQVSREL